MVTAPCEEETENPKVKIRLVDTRLEILKGNFNEIKLKN